MGYIFLEHFRKSNRLKQQELADFLGYRRREFISLIETGKNKLPDKKIDKILREGRLSMKWDVSSLNPAFHRLYEAANLVSNIKDRPDDDKGLNWDTGENLFHIDKSDVLKIKHGKIGINEDIATLILQTEPNFNKEWLKYGYGDIFANTAETNETHDSDTESGYSLLDRISRIEARLTNIEDTLKRIYNLISRM